MNPVVLRRSLRGLVLGAAIFTALGVILNREIGAPLFSNLGPVGVFALIGGTIGGLVGPLFGRRSRGPRGD